MQTELPNDILTRLDKLKDDVVKLIINGKLNDHKSLTSATTHLGQARHVLDVGEVNTCPAAVHAAMQDVQMAGIYIEFAKAEAGRGQVANAVTIEGMQRRVQRIGDVLEAYVISQMSNMTAPPVAS